MSGDLKGREAALAHERALLEKMETTVAEIKANESKLETEYKKLVEDKRLCEIKVKEEQKRNAKTLTEIQEREILLEVKQEDHKKLRKFIEKKQDAFIEVIKKKITAVDKDKKEAEAKKLELKHAVQDVEKISIESQKEIDIDQKKIDALLRERDILNKNVIKSDDQTKKQIELVKGKEGNVIALKKDIAVWKDQAVGFRKKIKSVEVQREKVGVEISATNAKYFQALEELKKREVRLMEVNKQIAEVNAKIAQQKTLYDQQVADREFSSSASRAMGVLCSYVVYSQSFIYKIHAYFFSMSLPGNVYSKNLIESNEEIAVVEQDFKVMFHQIEQLKEEIRDKEHQIVKEFNEQAKLGEFEVGGLSERKIIVLIRKLSCDFASQKT